MPKFLSDIVLVDSASSGINLSLGTTTGSKIGTSTSQKLGFYGVTPVTQRPATTDLKDALTSYGLIAGTSATDLNLDGGSFIGANLSVTAAVSGSILYLASTAYIGYESFPDDYGVNLTSSSGIFATSNGGGAFQTRFRYNTTGIGFFSATPVALQGATTDIKDALTNYGLLQGTSASPLNLDGGVLTAGSAGLGTSPGSSGVLNFGANTTASTGIYWGTDTNLYRSAADTLKTDDNFVVAGNLNVSGSTTLGNVTFTGFRSIYESRTMPVSTSSPNCVEIGSFAFTNGAGYLQIDVVVANVGFSVSKRYELPIAYNAASSYVIANPISNSGVYSGQDFDLDIQVTSGTCNLRLRRTSGTTAGTARITITQYGLVTDTYTSSSTTSTNTAPTSTYTPTPISVSPSAVNFSGSILSNASSFSIANSGSTIGTLDTGSGSYLQITATNGLTIYPGSGGTNTSSPINGTTFNGSQFNVTAYTLGTTSTDGLYLNNNTAATVGATVQMSPRIHLRGSAWKSNSTAVSQPHEWIVETLPATGAASTSSILRFGNNNNSAGWTYPLTMSDGGVLRVRNTTAVATGSANVYLDVVGNSSENAYARILGGAGATKGGLILGNNDGSSTNYGEWIFDNNTNEFHIRQLYGSGGFGLGANSRKYDIFMSATTGYVGFGYTSPGASTPIARISLTGGTTAAEGIAFGADTNLYRSASNMLATDDAMTIAGGLTSASLNTGAITATNIGATSITNNISTQRVIVSKAGTTIGTRQQINFIEGVGTTLTVADNSGSNRVDVTVNTLAGNSAYNLTFNATTDWGSASGGKYTITFTHNLNSYNCAVEVWDETSGKIQTFTGDMTMPTADTLTISVLSSPDGRFAGRIVILANGSGTGAAAYLAATQTFTAVNTFSINSGSNRPIIITQSNSGGAHIDFTGSAVGFGTEVPYNTTYNIPVAINGTQTGFGAQQLFIPVYESECFVAGTPVLTPTGSRKIETLQIGEKVISMDEESRFVFENEIVEVLVHEPRPNKGYLIINETMKVTDNHKIYVNDQWMPIGRAKIGDYLINAAGKKVWIYSIEEVDEQVTTYNIKVKHAAKNYFAHDLLVHNKCPFLYVFDKGKWIYQNTFIYELDSPEKETVQRRKLRTLTNEFVIREIEPETSYIKDMALIAITPNGEKRLKWLNKIENLVTNHRDFVKVSFEPLPPDTTELYVEAEGYYIWKGD